MSKSFDEDLTSWFKPILLVIGKQLYVSDVNLIE